MSFSKQLKHLLHPYAFVLKEGKTHAQDSLSYDLMLLQIDGEVIKSPAQFLSAEEIIQNELEALRTSLPAALAKLKEAGHS